MTDQTRRSLLAGVAGCAGLGALELLSGRARADDSSNLPMLKESDPAAQATQYTVDARRAKGATAGADCSNCSLYTSVKTGSGTCSIFPKNLVAAAGWCNAWSTL